MNGKYVSSRNAERILNVTGTSLRQWSNAGKIRLIRTPGGQRRYDISALLDTNAAESTDSNKPTREDGRRGVCYARVSSRGQRDDLQRQSDYLKSKCPDHDVITDIASGINWKRKGLKAILELAKQGAIYEVVVAARDRLCRFAFELLEHVFGMHDVRIVVLDSYADMSPEQELSNDLLSIVQIFCCRRNGRRRYAAAAHENAKDQTESDNSAETNADDVR